MNRDLSGSFGSEAYAREELRAQMASLFLSAELGVPFNPERHAAYQASWVKVLQDDKHEIFRAARDAEQIAEYVIDLARERSKDLDRDQAHLERTFEPDQSHSMSLPESPAVMAVAPLRSQFAAVRCDPLAFEAYGERAKPASEKYNQMLDAIERRLQPYAEYLSAHAAAADAQYYLDELWSREEKLGALLQLDSKGIESFVDKTFTLKAISRCAAAPFLVSDIEKQYQQIARELESKPQGPPEEGRAHAFASRLESGRANATHGRDNGNRELDQPVTPQPRHIQIKIEAWRRQHEALQAPAYRITLTSRREELKTYNMGKGRGPDGQEKFYTSGEIEEQIPFLSRQNARGYDIYVTPISESDHYMVLDDSTKAKINDIRERYGFRPCLVQESSPGNFQAVIRAEKKPGEHEQNSANICVRKLNQEYGDPKFSGAVHPFRVAGFSNAKPKYENEHGHRPFVRTIEAQNAQCPQASQWLERTRREHEQDLKQPHERQLKQAPTQEPAHMISDHDHSFASAGALTKDQQTVNERFLQAREQHRGLAKQKGWTVNDSVLDYRATRDCLRQGDDPECVKCALETCSPAISGRHSNVRHYSERTLAKALEDSQVQKLRAKALGRQQKQGQVLGL